MKDFWGYAWCSKSCERAEDGAGYEMLADHNRMNAAKQAGITELPTIVKENLPNEDACVYVIETNPMQRSFAELLLSEKAAVLAERYDKILYQRNREDIIKEFKEMKGDTKGGHSDHLSINHDNVRQKYGLSGSLVARLLWMNKMMPELKDKLDAGELNFVTAVQLSYDPEEVRRETAVLDKPISKDMAVKLREEGVTAEDLEALGLECFIVMAASDYNMLDIRENTGYMWHIHNSEYPREGTCIIFHNHRTSHPY